MSVLPPKSKAFGRGPGNRWVSLFESTATILSPSIATASATRSDASIVRTWPLKKIRAGGSAAKACAGMSPAAKATEMTLRNTDGLLGWTRPSDAFDDALRHLLGVAEQHHRVVAVEQRVIDSCVSGCERPLDEHHGAVLPALKHRHAVDRRGLLLLTSLFGDVVGADHAGDVGLCEFP